MNIVNDPADGWEATCVIAWDRPNVRQILVQRWRRPIINSFGYLSGWEYEWRKVPDVREYDFFARHSD